ncbi:hypothetical protein HPB48_008934 [Haemaphysalis longicornis]|uniref:CCHC-type domain-containing protein n=1 Tax=Haemaphysalis longicornis TaxID=44386 RepID=A0A9J6H5E2_HAELO|nr:hypothetical protein HPB48_008934 [Haemaphysalis longicornis]
MASPLTSKKTSCSPSFSCRLEKFYASAGLVIRPPFSSRSKGLPYLAPLQQCLHCFSLEHRALDCPNRNVFLCCVTCGTKFPPDQSPSDTRHNCEPRCVNCNGEHPATEPNCPARDEATKNRKRSRDKRWEKSPHGFKNRNRSRSRRCGQRVVLKVNHSSLPQNIGFPPRLDSRKHEVIANVPCVNSPAPPPTRQPMCTHIDIQNIVPATLDQILLFLLEQEVFSIVSQALCLVLASLQELTARLASLEDDRLPHKRTPTSAEDCDSMQKE